MTRPFLACLILTGIHVYLGLHVVERGVIFVDLALAQTAALGAAVGFLLGYELHSLGSYLLSLTFALTAAAAFAATRFRKPVVPQEALIGILYAVAGAALILVLNEAPEGGEGLKALMVGHLLFVDWLEILKVVVMYSIIGFFHWRFRSQFLLISQDPEGAFRQGYRVRLWDFLFYATFGFVVTSSVELAGVLLVFSFLVVPAVCGMLLSATIVGRLTIGWVVSLLTSMAGILLSYQLDLPTGATVVCVFGIATIICGAIHHLRATHV
ncbi:MAG: metal ABC transporter permease [Proteobacteria bacterium]|nr:metal ABC transporter permease [Pseudomonadota bacterium]